MAKRFLLKVKFVESYQFSSGLTLENAEIIYKILSSPEFRTLYYCGSLPIFFPSKYLFIISCFSPHHHLSIAYSFCVYLALLLLSHSHCLNHGSLASVNHLPTNVTTGSKMQYLRDNYCFAFILL